MTFKSNISNNPRTFIVAKGGDDAQSGQTFETAKLTIASALAAVNALSPPSSVTDPTAILTSGAGNFQESISLPDGCQFAGENIFNFPVTGNAFEPASQASFEILSSGVEAASAVVFDINNKTEVGVVSKSCVVLGASGVGVHVRGTSDEIFINIEQLSLEADSATGILDESDNGAPEIYNVDELVLLANNTCGFRHNPTDSAAEANLNAGLIGAVGSFTGTKGIEVLNGILDAFVNKIDAVDAITVSNNSTLNIVCDRVIGDITVDVGCTLNVSILSHSGTITNNGTINGTISSVTGVTHFGNTDFLENLTVQQDLALPGGFIDLTEIATPANPSADTGRLYSEDVAGTTSLFFRDSSGATVDLTLPTSIYATDGTITSGEDRTVLGEAGTELEISMRDLTASDFLTQGRLALHPDMVRLSFDQGDGAGAVTTIQEIQLISSGMRVVDTTNDQGFIYASDYSANFVTRSLVDRAFVEGTALVFVNALGAFPAPVANVITLAANTVYMLLANIDTAGDQIQFGAASFIRGVEKDSISLSGTTTLPLFIGGGNPLGFENITILQEGTGDLAELDSAGSQHRFINTVCQGGVVRGIAGNKLVFDSSNLEAGATFIQDASGGVNVLGFVNFFLNDESGTDDMIVFEAGSTTTRLEGVDGGSLMFGTGSAIKVEGGATIDVVTMDLSNFILGANAFGITVENPDDVLQGSLDNNNFAGAGTSLKCDPVSSSNFSTITTETRGACVDNDGNLITCEIVTDTITRYVGLTDVEESTIGSTDGNVQGIAWHAGNLYTTDIGGPTKKHNGFSTSTLEQINLPNTTQDITFVGDDLVGISSQDDEITVYDGFSITEKESFAAPASDIDGITFDGLNLITTDSVTNLVYVHLGVSATIQYTFSTSLATTRAIEAFFGQFLEVTLTTVSLYDHPVTFDQSSATWEMSNNADGLTESSDRGGSSFDNGITYLPVTVVQDEWTDIDDGATDLFYGSFSELEKTFLSDETNGEMTWTGVRTKGRIISGTVNVARTGTTDRQLELAIVINGSVQSDSKASVFLTNTEPVTLITLPVSKTLAQGDTVKLQFKDLSSANGEEFALAKMSIV